MPNLNWTRRILPAANALQKITVVIGAHMQMHVPFAGLHAQQVPIMTRESIAISIQPTLAFLGTSLQVVWGLHRAW
jgi:hypothetical protein